MFLPTGADAFESAVCSNKHPLSLVVEVGALARILQVLEGPGWPAPLGPLPRWFWQIAGAHNCGRLLIRRVRSLADRIRRSPDVVAHSLQRQTVIPIILNQCLLKAWIVVPLPTLAPHDALKPRCIGISPLVSKRTPYVLQAVGI